MGRRNKGPRLDHFTEKEYQRSGYTTRPWIVRDRVDGRSIKFSTGTEDHDEAFAKLKEYMAGKQGHPVRRGDPDEVFVTDILSIYADEHAPSTGDPKRIAYANRALIPFWQGKKVSDVTEKTCRAYQKHRTNVGDGTVRRELGTLQTALNYCRDKGHLSGQETGFWKPDKPQTKQRSLTRKEAGALLRAARAHKRSARYLVPFIRLTLYCGNRKEATLALQWQENIPGGWIDFDSGETGVIDFNRGDGRRTRKARSTPPIHFKLLPMLRHLRESNAQYVLERANGSRLADIRHSLKKVATAAGLPWVTPHTLVHTCCTWMLERGVSFDQVSLWTGRSVETLKRTYYHFEASHLQHLANPPVTRPLSASSTVNVRQQTRGFS